MQRDYSANERIRKFIEDNDKKPTAIADKSGIRRDVFSRIIRSKRPLYADEISPICDALGMPVYFLFEDTGKGA